MQESTELQKQDATFDTSSQSAAEAPERNKNALDTLRALWTNFRQPKPDQRPRLTWGEKFKQLSYSQWMYFVAFFVLINNASEASWDDADIILVGIIAGVGLARELWQLFYKMWNTMFGKGVILVLYAATANFALAIAALKVNAIAGVEPTPLRFTIGFTLLVMLPMWIFVSTVFLSSTLLMIGNLWSLFALLLRIIRIKLPIHWEDRSFAGVSMLLRLILLPFVVMAMYSVIEPYLKQVYVFDSPLKVVKTDIGSEVYKELQALPEEERRAKVKELEEAGLIEVEIFGQEANVSGLISEEMERKQQTLEEESEQNVSGEASAGETITEDAVSEKSTEDEDTPSLTIDRMIAAFIFHLETYRYSSCKKEPEQRVLTLDEYSMLMAERDGDNPLGYTFSIQQCIPFYPTTGKTYQGFD